MCSMQGEQSCVKLSHSQLAFHAPASPKFNLHLLALRAFYHGLHKKTAVFGIPVDEYKRVLRQTDRQKKKKNSAAFNLQTSHDTNAFLFYSIIFSGARPAQMIWPAELCRILTLHLNHTKTSKSAGAREGSAKVCTFIVAAGCQSGRLEYRE